MTAHSLPTLVAIVLAVVAGLAVGSFLNVVAYRAPRGLSVSKPRSFCTSCRRQLTWWENVPVASWVLLGGRCHTCHEAISARYPLVESGTAGVFALIAVAWNGSVLTIAYCVLASTVIAIGLIESQGLRTPLAVAAIGAAIGDIAVVAGAAADRHWSVVLGAQVGLGVGIASFAVLRHFDPTCDRPVGHGRGALVVAGCWLGGTGRLGSTLGLGVGVAVLLGCILLRQVSATAPDGPAPAGSAPAGSASEIPPARQNRRRWVRRVTQLPLLTGVVAALATSLIVIA